MTERTALVPLTGMYENTSKAGKHYFTGYLGKAKLVMFESRDAKEGEPTWTLFVAERPPAKPQAATVERE